LAWAGLAAAVDGATPDLIRRACGRASGPDREAALRDADPYGAAVVRGIALAVLLEERLLTRFGHAWTAERRAGALLAELWEADADETAESAAAALGLGRMEAAVLVDRCGP
jgi:hypothetical protein